MDVPLVLTFPNLHSDLQEHFCVLSCQKNKKRVKVVLSRVHFCGCLTPCCIESCNHRVLASILIDDSSWVRVVYFAPQFMTSFAYRRDSCTVSCSRPVTKETNSFRPVRE